MAKFKVIPNEADSVALRKRPCCPYLDSVIRRVVKGTVVVPLDSIMYDKLGEKEYTKVRLENGVEGYILSEVLQRC